ncbi:hypothetical protein [Bradyrhizobium liaoningense]|uniref:hypothetical protein n=1 Tax=Bradyrhizobium liaoningense TaxID=43992 RepID=UPI001BAA6D99|nr:hypothetical protein [Bradyrhizobium liaoningense]MBR0717530.1 hypothetical protein [Bradyrhizobium liaoningense]
MSTADSIAARPAATVVPGRECGSCTLCCKVYDVAEINKVAGKWCSKCKPGRGCTIHDSLPRQCADFNCLWRTDAEMPPQWKPDQAKMVVTIHPKTENIMVRVDPGLPSAWQRQPYYGHLRQWSRNNLPKGWYVIVFVNELATLVLPDQDLPIGPLAGDQTISLRHEPGPNGGVYEVKVATIRTTPDGQTFEIASTSRHQVRPAA